MNFPLKTLFLCLTLWSVATEILIFDYIKFSAKAELLEQTTRVLDKVQSGL